MLNSKKRGLKSSMTVNERSRLSLIFKSAWIMARDAVKKFGGTAKQYFKECLRIAMKGIIYKVVDGINKRVSIDGLEQIEYMIANDIIKKRIERKVIESDKIFNQYKEFVSNPCKEGDKVIVTSGKKLSHGLIGTIEKIAYNKYDDSIPCIFQNYMCRKFTGITQIESVEDIFYMFTDKKYLKVPQVKASVLIRLDDNKTIWTTLNNLSLTDNKEVTIQDCISHLYNIRKNII